MNFSSPTKKYVFSTTWRWASFDSFERKNLSDSEFIISNNFSPFAGQLIDAYLMVALNYKKIENKTNISQKNRHFLENVSFYLLLKTYFDDPIKISYEIEPYQNSQNNKKIEIWLQKLVISN